MNVQIELASSQEGFAREIIGSMTMDREKADAVDWNHIDSAYSFSYATSEPTNGISTEVQRFNQSSGYSLPELPAVTATSGSTYERITGSGQIILYALAGLGFLILWRLIRRPIEAPESVPNRGPVTTEGFGTLSNEFRKSLASTYRWLEISNSGEHFSISLENDHEILNVVPRQTPDAEERAAIAEAGPADVDSEPSRVEDLIARFVRYATSWAFAKAEDGKPYFQPCVLRQLRGTNRYVLGVGFLLTNEEVLQAIGEDKGRTGFRGEVMVNWVARCAEQSGALSRANLMYLLSSQGLLISIRDAVCEVSDEVARDVLQLPDTSKITARRALRNIPETLTFLAPPMIRRCRRPAQVFRPQVCEEARPAFRSVLRGLADGDCSAFLKAKATFYSTETDDAHEYVVRALDAAFSAGIISLCAEVMDDELPGRFAAYLSRALQALEAFASYDHHPEIVFQSNYAGIPVTVPGRQTAPEPVVVNGKIIGWLRVRVDERQIAAEASTEARKQIQQRSDEGDRSTDTTEGDSTADDWESGRFAPWADFEEAGRETVIDEVLATAFIESLDAKGIGGIIGHLSRVAAQHLAFLFQLLSNAIVDSDDDPAWNALQRVLSAGGWTSEDLFQRMRALTLKYGSWAARAEPCIPDEINVGSLEEDFTGADLVLPLYAPPPTGGYLIICTTHDELLVQHEEQATVGRPTSANAKKGNVCE